MCVYLRVFTPDLDVENTNFPLPFPGFVDISVGFVLPCPVSKRIWTNVRRIIGKWLSAEVMEAGNVAYSEQGTPQGGVISPLLSNIPPPLLRHLVSKGLF
jgi:hypothetical protein